MKPYSNRLPHQLKAQAFGENGMVAAAQPLTTYAAVRVLEEGGNAVDTAIAAATVNNVVLPASCGIGGDAFILAYIHKEGRVVGINGSGIGPHYGIGEMRRQGYTKMPLDGALSVALPGAVDAYDQLWQKYGSMPLERLLAPAIRLAKEGFLVTERTSSWLRLSAPKLSKDPDAAAIFLDTSNLAPGPGGKLVQPDLAGTLERLSRSGFRDFYEGEIAMDSTGNALVVWNGGGDTLVKRFNGSSWAMTEMISNESSGGPESAGGGGEIYVTAKWPEIAMNPDGDAIVIWQHASALWTNRLD